MTVASIALIAVMALAQTPATDGQAPAAPLTCVPAVRTELKLDNLRDGMLYVPKGYTKEKPLPLLVWLHGAGGSGNVSQALGDLADEFGIIVLAPDSRSWTWGSILGDWDPDLEFLQQAMLQTQRRCAVDKDRIWLGGFSDG